MSGRFNIAFIAVFMLLLGLTLVKAGVTSINCGFINNQNEICDGTTVFKISTKANAHAEIQSYNNYNYSACCKTNSGYSLGTNCAGGFNVIRLSNQTNAHVEQNNYTNYLADSCLSISSAAGEILCTYTTQNCSDIGYDTCIATISSQTNAHIADCTTDPYPIKVCCMVDCVGYISGVVKDENDMPVASAQVGTMAYINNSLAIIQSTATNAQGFYNGTFRCGNYTLVASHPDYIPRVKDGIVVELKKELTLNFTDENALVLGSSCEQDCTLNTDNIVHASCDGRNGCTFYDDVAKAACDNSQPGWIRDYGQTQYVICASGSPQPKIETQASVTCGGETLVKVTRIAVYKGKPVKLVVAVCE